MAVTSNVPDSGVIWSCKLSALCRVPMNYFWKGPLCAHKRVWLQQMLDGLICQAPAEDAAPASCFPFSQCTMVSAVLFPVTCYGAQSPFPTGPEPKLSSQWSVVHTVDLCSHSEFLQGTWTFNPLPFHPLYSH